MVVKLPTERIVDWDSFHSVFREVFAFPDCYGRNMNAWIDCLTYVDDPDDVMSNVHLGKNETLQIEVPDSAGFRARAPEAFEALVRCTAFLNKGSATSGRSSSSGCSEAAN